MELCYDVERVIGDFLEDELPLCEVQGIKARRFKGDCATLQPEKYEMERFECTRKDEYHICRLDFDCSKLKSYDTQGDVESLEPLRGAPITNLAIDWFDGDLDPLCGAPLEVLHMYAFNGNLDPLYGAPIREITMDAYDGDIEALRDSPVEEICMHQFDAELWPLEHAPLKLICLPRCFDDVNLLFGFSGQYSVTNAGTTVRMIRMPAFKREDEYDDAIDEMDADHFAFLRKYAKYKVDNQAVSCSEHNLRKIGW